MLIGSQYFSDIFQRLGTLDDDRARMYYSSLPKHTPWGWGADAGNKGREIDMIAVSIWSEQKNAPEYVACAAADLLGDQSSKNLAATLDRYTSAKGLHPEGCVHGMTDGATPCAGNEGEAALFHRMLSSRAASDPEAPVHSAKRETCAIHGKALEEVHGLEAGFPQHTLCWFLRLIWECFSRASGHADYFRKIWTEDCRLPPNAYDYSLGMLPEPTEAKWQVIYDVCWRFHGLFIVPPGRHGFGMTMIEDFLAKCLDLIMRGTEDRRLNLASSSALRARPAQTPSTGRGSDPWCADQE